MHQPTISVIVPNFNHSEFLIYALENILSQTFPATEILVIDDGSTDNSVEIVEHFLPKHPTLRLIKNDKNRGVIFTANRGLELASGNYIYFAAADDRTFPELFEKSISLLERHPHAGLSSAIVEVERDGRRIPEMTKDISSRECYFSPEVCVGLLRRRDNWMGGNSTVFRREALIEAGGLLPELGPLCDLFVEMVIAAKHGVCFIPVSLSVRRLSAASYSAIETSNFNASIQMYSRAANLMMTTYMSLFPTDFIDAWKEREIYRTRLVELKRLQRQQIVLFKSFFTHEQLCDRLIGCISTIFMQLQLGLVALYLFFRLGKNFRQVIDLRLLVAMHRIRQRMNIFIARYVGHS
jgi:glycosyltransferase involved in cell wall biosynthesis